MAQTKFCSDCGFELRLTQEDSIEGAIVKCPSCGLEFEYRAGKLLQLTIEGEDWGE